jgi:mRNA interferase MazF
VSRQPLIDSKYSTVICAPVFTQRHDLPTQVALSIAEGLKHESAIQCDGLMSLEKSRLTDFVGELAPDKLRELDNALIIALGVPTATSPWFP